ncbi:PCRF domain-containing protein [Candidatus Nasuia deltocephalinicola]|uniref:PCRF domain-containing protein n=1 Tax=Candidatus Nasuia deltocephalincola TaxID=1160784 RepID=UPI002A4E1110|nr:PCRF domain-containing protein [Candidatus Nasuia deltocephalinicola]
MKSPLLYHWANDPRLKLKDKIKKYIKKYKIKNLKNNKFKKFLKIYNNIKKCKNDIKDLKKIISQDKEIYNLATEEIDYKKKYIKNLKILIKKIFKKNKKTEKIIMEIKIGVGGEESAFFISDLKKMYEKYFEKMKWKKKIISETTTNMKACKESIIIIKGKNIYKNLKYESGVHRVQREPKTENKGKIHTSTCRVAVYKKKKKIKNKIKKSELKIETFKSSGAGGQHVNKTNSAVRLRHIPTNIIVECQKERSQHKNKKHALKVMQLKINEFKNIKKNNKSNIIKKKLLGKGKRVEKIRTYNYKNNTVIDHRFKIKIKLDIIMNGKLKKLIQKIKNVIKKGN